MTYGLKTKGFTLIELVIVILILGVLAALAIPKFISLQREARIANVDTMFNATRSGSNIVFAKTAAAGLQTDATACVNLESGITSDNINACGDIETVAVNTRFGYPQNATAAGGNLKPLFDDLSNRWSFTAAGASFDGIVIGACATPAPTGCGVCFTQAAAAGQRPIIRRAIAGC